MDDFICSCGAMWMWMTNGQFDEGVDSEFDYRLVAGTARPSRHFHMHADMIDGQDLTLGIRVDVRILLLLAVDSSCAPTPVSVDITAMRS
jgi:hypothetical protein